MKRLLLPLLLLVFKTTFGQTNYYTYNEGDSLIDEKEAIALIDTAIKRMPDNFVIRPIIYHRIIKNDSIINYFTVRIHRIDSVFFENRFEFSFVQDSLFLLLDKKLPYFKLKDLSGKEFSTDQLIGKPSLLNFWSISCSPCILEIPELNMLKEKYGDRMNFIAFAEDNGEDLLRFLAKQPFNYHILQNADNYKKDLKIKAIPKNIFIDKYGYIRYIKGNFPYTAIDLKKGIKEHEENNYFIKIIEELTKNGS